MAGTIETRNIRVDRSFISIVVATSFAFGLALTLIPGPEERAAVYQELGRYSDAIAVLETAQMRNGLTPYEAYALAELYELVGRIDDLTALIEAEIRRDPSAGWAQEKLATLVPEHTPSGAATSLADLSSLVTHETSDVASP